MFFFQIETNGQWDQMGPSEICIESAQGKPINILFIAWLLSEDNSKVLQWKGHDLFFRQSFINFISPTVFTKRMQTADARTPLVQ